MKEQLIQLLVSFYRLLLWLYPRRFYEEFGEEMTAVFHQNLTTTPNNWHILAVSLRELRDWPANCWREHWHERQRSFMTYPSQPISWRGTLAAITPLLLVTLLVGMPLLAELAGINLAALPGQVVSYGLIALILAGISIGWWRGWPVWSASWLGLVVFVLFYLWGPSLLYQAEHEWNTVPRLLQMILSEAFAPLLWLLVLYWLLQRWPQAGLLAFLPALGLEGLLYTEWVPEVSASLIMLIIWLWLVLMGVLLLRLRRRIWDAWILGLSALFAGSLYIVAAYFFRQPPLVREQTLAAMVTNLVPLLLRGLIPFIGLMLLHALWLWVRSHGRFALQAYRFILTGAFLNLAALLSFRRLMLPGDLTAFQANGLQVITAVFIISLILVLRGSGRLLKHHGQWTAPSVWLIWLLMALILIFPLAYQADVVVDGYNVMVFRQIPFDLFFWQWAPTIGLSLSLTMRVVSMIWLLLAGIVLSLLHQRQLLEPTATAVPPNRVGTAVTSQTGAKL